VKKKNKKVRTSYKTLILVGLILFAVISLGLIYSSSLRKIECSYEADGRGWTCWSPTFFLTIPKDDEIEYEAKCTREGGEFSSMVVTYGMTQGGGIIFQGREGRGVYFDCLIPWSDYGAPCNNNDECDGDCEYIGDIPSFCKEGEDDVYTCSEAIQGSCTKSGPSGDSFCGPARRVAGNTIKVYGWCIWDLSKK